VLVSGVFFGELLVWHCRSCHPALLFVTADTHYTKYCRRDAEARRLQNCL